MARSDLNIPKVSSKVVLAFLIHTIRKLIYYVLQYFNILNTEGVRTILILYKK